MKFPLTPKTLRGDHVELIPMQAEHSEALAQVGLDPSLWEWIPTRVNNEAEMKFYVDEAMDLFRNKKALPFVISTIRENRVIGSTRFANIDLEHRRMEIGWTWFEPKFHGTAANKETKLLMLQYAFEELDCLRVELKTDRLNAQSRRAILSLGAKEEGTLRQHMVTSTGRIRDTVYFSILKDEWPEVKEKLIRKIKEKSAIHQ